MEKLIEPFGKFNRYWLRYGPNTMALTAYLYFYNICGLKDLIGKNNLSLIGILFVNLGIQYLFTWPMLFIHAFRTDYEGAVKHSLIKSKLNYDYQT